MMDTERRSLTFPVRAAIVLVGAAALWLAIAVSIANVYRNHDPELVLKWSWFDAGAKARLASNLVQRQDVADNVARARSLARDSLRREPVNVAAARTLGVLEAIEGDAGGAERAFRYADGLSRRDGPTQLWRIEYFVARGDIPRAIHQYDIALRTSEENFKLLAPILISASENQTIARPLGALLQSRPPWWREFVSKIIREGDNPLTARYLSQGLLDPTRRDDARLIAILLDKLVKTRAFDAAWSFYREVSGARTLPPIRNAGFESDNLFPPIDWRLVQEPGLAAELGARPDGQDGQALFLIQSEARSGVVARQLLGLAPGAYRLTAEVGGSGGDSLGRPVLSVACAGDSSETLAQTVFPDAAQRTAELAVAVTVPPGCAAQWLTISAQGRWSSPGNDVWIDSLALHRM